MRPAASAMCAMIASLACVASLAPVPAGADPSLIVQDTAVPGLDPPAATTPIMDPSSAPRETMDDAPDAVEGKQTHVIYFVPADKPDEDLDAGPLPGAINAIRSWFATQTSNEQMPSLRPRFDQRIGGGWDISFARGSLPAADYRGIRAITDDLIAQGFTQEHKRYLVYAAASADAPGNPGGICGESYYPLPATQRRPFAVVYLDANPGCGARDFSSGGLSSAIAAHEWLHLEGISPLIARHHCPTQLYHICTGPLWAVPPMTDPAEVPRLDPEAPDLMFPLIHQPLNQAVLDRNRDDYLDHGVPMIHDLRRSEWME